MSHEISNRVSAVAIGRNEGERLERCLRALINRVDTVVYVDSGSTDGSVEFARRIGAETVLLDTSQPFTAARARNAGLRRLLEIDPAVTFVQFVDGDCEVAAGWIEKGRDYLAAHDDVAVVSGRRRERHPEATCYNRLCDMEWDTPVGEVRTCHGDAMMRVTALRGVDGFREDLIAGEEPEMCVRLRAAAWRIVRIDAEMTWHDAAMTRFGQWWRRNVRAGHAYAEGAALHGSSAERHWVREHRSNWCWGAALPAAAILPAWITGGWSLLLLVIYPLQTGRMITSRQRQGSSFRDAWLYSTFCVLGKFPQMTGQARYWLGRWRRKRSTLIEYKGQAS